MSYFHSIASDSSNLGLNIKIEGDSLDIKFVEKIQAGSQVVWVSNGFVQWSDSRKIKSIGYYEGRAFALFEGSDTGIPVEDLQVVEGK